MKELGLPLATGVSVVCKAAYDSISLRAALSLAPCLAPMAWVVHLGDHSQMLLSDGSLPDSTVYVFFMMLVSIAWWQGDGSQYSSHARPYWNQSRDRQRIDSGAR